MEFTKESLDLMSKFILTYDIFEEIIPKYSKKNKLRCTQCKKKLSMMSFTCKCGNMYCIAHQTPHTHNCSYNYKLDLQNQIEKNNPKLGQKLVKI